MTNFLRCIVLSIVLLPLTALAYSKAPYRLFGAINRRLRLFDTFFFVYPANTTYARHYAPGWFTRYARWVPFPIGFMSCGGSRGLVFGSLMTEKEFLSRRNATQFTGLMRRMEAVAEMTGLSSIRMCGILPSTAAKRGETFFEDTSHVAAQVVMQAFVDLRAREKSGDRNTLAILLGGAGLVGAQVAEMMERAGIPHAVLDPAAGPVDMSVFDRKGPAILVDIARKGVLEKYLDHLPKGMVVLNETYPEPGRKVQRALAERGASLFHIRGVQGNVWPRLPGGYSDAIPCCGAPTDGRDVEVRLSQLVPERFDLPPAKPVPMPEPLGLPVPALPALSLVWTSASLPALAVNEASIQRMSWETFVGFLSDEETQQAA